MYGMVNGRVRVRIDIDELDEFGSVHWVIIREDSITLTSNDS